MPDLLILLNMLLIGGGIAIAIMGIVLMMVPITPAIAAWIAAGGICLALAAAWAIIQIEPRD